MAAEKPTPPESDRVIRKQAQLALKQVALAAGQTVIVARGPRVLAHRGDLNLTEAQAIAVHVAEGWLDRGQTARVQFMRLPLLTDERLLYTQPLANDFLLTIAEGADSNLPRVSALARQIRPLLESVGLSGPNTGPAPR